MSNNTTRATNIEISIERGMEIHMPPLRPRQEDDIITLRDIDTGTVIKLDQSMFEFLIKWNNARHK